MKTLINWLIGQIKRKTARALAAAGYVPRYYIRCGELIFKRGWRGKRAFVISDNRVFMSTKDWV